jgi:hypothetical protein
VSVTAGSTSVKAGAGTTAKTNAGKASSAPTSAASPVGDLVSDVRDAVPLAP